MYQASAVAVLALASCTAFVHHAPLQLQQQQAQGRLRSPLRMAGHETERGGVDRRQMIKIISTSVVGLTGLCAPAQLGIQAAAAAEKLDPATVAGVRGEVSEIIKRDPNKGPTIVRLAWHNSGTHDRTLKDGGSYGGTIRYKSELAHGANAGLAAAVEWLEPVKAAHPSISYGDLYTLAGIEAIATMGGPQIGWRAGRQDLPETAVTPDGRLPAADKGNPAATAEGLRETFYRMGFNDQEIVALSGAHALGRCHKNASGYEGPWTPTPTTFNNAYFVLLKNLNWTPKKWSGPFQYEDASGSLMMLPSDLVLLEDAKFKKWVDVYAGSETKFFSDFSKAFQKLEELGTSGLYTV